MQTDMILSGHHTPSQGESAWLPRHFRRGITIIATMRGLHAFRQVYHDLLDFPAEIMARRALHGTTIELPVLSALISGVLPLAGMASLALYKKGLNQSIKFWSSHKGLQPLSLVGILIFHRLGNKSLGALGYIHCSRCIFLIISGMIY